MRVVAWNCHDRLDRKLPGLMGLRPDIAVVSEVGEADLRALPQGVSAVWTGDPQGGKGLAVLGFDGWDLTAGPPCAERWFLPVSAVRQDRAMRVLGVWTLPAKDYVTPTARALAQVGDFLAGGASLCAGDFNQNVRWDPGRSAPRRFAHVLERFDALGLTSVWHEHRAEAHGAETEATHFPAGRRRAPTTSTMSSPRRPWRPASARSPLAHTPTGSPPGSAITCRCPWSSRTGEARYFGWRHRNSGYFIQCHRNSSIAHPLVGG